MNYLCNFFSLTLSLVFDDLGEITRRHFKDLQTLVRQRRQEEVHQPGVTAEQSQYYQTGPVQQPTPVKQYLSTHRN